MSRVLDFHCFSQFCSRRLRSRVVSPLDFYTINIYAYQEDNKEGKENKERRVGSVYRVSACI